MRRPWKAADVPDTLYLACVVHAQRERKSTWATRWDISERLPVPEKVLLAKAKRLVDRGLMTGCACGCRGGFELTDAGKQTLDVGRAA